MSKLISQSDKIFVAGGSGMAGSAICRSLIKNGYKKILNPSRRKLDLLNYEEVKRWFNQNRPSVVIIAAAKVGGIIANTKYPADFILENLKIQNNLIEIAWKFNVKRLLFLGSSCIYPKFSSQPIIEEELLNGKLEETNQWYAIAKISGIKMCESLRIQYGFDAISLMPTNLYGPKDNYDSVNSHVMASLIKKFFIAVLKDQKEVTCWGTGKPLREFLHVDDLGDAVVFALENWDPKAKNAPLDNNNKSLFYLNVGTGQDITIKKLTSIIACLTGFKGKVIWDKSKPDGTPKKQLNTSKINKLGWEPKIALEEGIKKTIESFKNEYN